jgi:hypothetical protein
MRNAEVAEVTEVTEVLPDYRFAMFTPYCHCRSCQTLPDLARPYEAMNL